MAQTKPSKYVLDNADNTVLARKDVMRIRNTSALKDLLQIMNCGRIDSLCPTGSMAPLGPSRPRVSTPPP